MKKIRTWKRTGVQTSFSGKLVLEAVPAAVFGFALPATITNAHFLH
jgi:hypothetical protein